MTSGRIPPFGAHTWRTLTVYVRCSRPRDEPTTALVGTGTRFPAQPEPEADPRTGPGSRTDTAVAPAASNQGDSRGVKAGLRRRWRAPAVVLIAVSGVLLAVLTDPVIAGAALATGILNTAGGGGAVVTFFALTAAGVPALTAHATSQVVTPVSFLGGLRATRGYRPDPRWVWSGMAGAVCGVVVLAVTPPATFQVVAPWCLLPAAALVVAQEPVRRLVRRTGRWIGPNTTIVAVFVCGVYAGMIGVGTGTLAVAVLGLVPAFVRTPLALLLHTRNRLLLIMAIVVAATFAVTGLADWTLVALLAAPAAVGGWLGTKLIGRVPHWVLRAVIVVTALAGTAWLVWPA